MNSSPTDEEKAMALAEAIHRTMCFRGRETATCGADRGDGLDMLDDLKARGWDVTHE